MSDHDFRPSISQRSRLNRRLLVLGSLVTAAAAVAGQRTARGEDQPDVGTILKEASQRLAETTAMHFTLEVDGKTYIDEGDSMRLLNAKGDMARPDKVDVQVQLEIVGQKISVRMISIGKDAWITDLITGQWVTAPKEFGYNPSVLYDNQNGLGPVAGKLKDANVEGTEQVDDRECYRVTGASDAKTIGKLTSNTMDGDPISIEAWIDTETSDFRRILIAEPESEQDHATWTLNLSQHDEKVSIEPPS